jgi:zinc transporter ZupT
MGAPALASAIGAFGAFAGLWLAGARKRARVLVPFSAGLLLGLVVFGIAPELVVESGWAASLAWTGAGYALLILVDRYIYPVCTSCAHDHDHDACSKELHGFAAPLLTAAALHSFLDGWSIATAQSAAPGLRLAIPLAVAMHKIPEGIALGGMLRVSMRSRTAAFGWSALAEGTTVVGAVAGLMAFPYLGSEWTIAPLGLAAGWLLFLAYHAMHEEAKREGTGPALLAAAAGATAAALLLRGAGALTR